VKELQKIVPLKPKEQQFRLIDLVWNRNLERWGEEKESNKYSSIKHHVQLGPFV